MLTVTGVYDPKVGRDDLGGDNEDNEELVAEHPGEVGDILDE